VQQVTAGTHQAMSQGSEGGEKAATEKQVNNHVHNNILLFCFCGFNNSLYLYHSTSTAPSHFHKDGTFQAK
jgi:hypothetical protein